jgi:hypothetical protein
MREVIYARFSTDLQSAASLDDQVRICRERIEQDKHQLGITRRPAQMVIGPRRGFVPPRVSAVTFMPSRCSRARCSLGDARMA